MTDASIIIPAYNEEDHIEACIESVATQETNFDFEIIVCDDGSTDKTLHILRDLESRYDSLKVVESERNGGILLTLNKCFAQSSGEYILRIDADCTLKPESLQNWYYHLQSVDIVYGKVHVENTDKLHPASCELGKERGTGSWYGGACVGFQSHVVHDLNGFMGVRQNIEREVMNRAESEGWTVRKVTDVAVTSVFPESITEWLPRKFNSGRIYVRECADSPAAFSLWELRGPMFWTLLGLLSALSVFIGIFGASAYLSFQYQDGRYIARESGNRRYVLLYPLYQVVSGIARTVGVWRESPLLVRTLVRKYA